MHSECLKITLINVTTELIAVLSTSVSSSLLGSIAAIFSILYVLKNVGFAGNIGPYLIRCIMILFAILIVLQASNEKLYKFHNFINEIERCLPNIFEVVPLA